VPFPLVMGSDSRTTSTADDEHVHDHVNVHVDVHVIVDVVGFFIAPSYRSASDLPLFVGKR
jgi:hypothetical protein